MNSKHLIARILYLGKIYHSSSDDNLKEKLIDKMESTVEKYTKQYYTIEDIEKCVENWGLCKVEKEYIEKFLDKLEEY